MKTNIRVALDEKGQAHFWLWDNKEEDWLEKELPAAEAFRLMSTDKARVEVAWRNPDDTLPHQWEFSGKPQYI